MNRIYENLLKLRDLTEEVSGLLYQEDLESILEKLRNRKKLIETVQESWQNSDTKSEETESGIKLTDIKLLFKSIMALDKKNMEVVNLKLNKLSNSLAEITKEKQNVKGIRSISKVKQKQIVDFLY